MAAVSQPSLLSHTYALPQPPSFNHSVTAQSPIIGVTPSIQAPVPPQHPLMTAHFQLTPQSTQQPPSMVLSMPSQPPYASAQPTVTPSALTAQANPVVHPNAHSMIGNGHLTSHPSLIQPHTLPLTNGQAAAAAAAAHGQQTAADNQDGPNGLQMLRTVGSGKYEFSDPGHPKGKQGHCKNSKDDLFFMFFKKDYKSLSKTLKEYIKADLFGRSDESKLGRWYLILNWRTLGSLLLVTSCYCVVALE